jgi:hypothetical protein
MIKPPFLTSFFHYTIIILIYCFIKKEIMAIGICAYLHWEIIPIP